MLVLDTLFRFIHYMLTFSEIYRYFLGYRCSLTNDTITTSGCKDFKHVGNKSCQPMKEISDFGWRQLYSVEKNQTCICSSYNDSPEIYQFSLDLSSYVTITSCGLVFRISTAILVIAFAKASFCSFVLPGYIEIAISGISGSYN